MKTNQQVFLDFINQGDSVLILGSRRLDFDCIATGLLLKKYLESLGKKVTFCFPRALTEWEKEYYRFLPYFEEVLLEDSRKLLGSPFADLLIFIDGTILAQYFDETVNAPTPSLGNYPQRLHIDHHLHHPEELAKEKIYDSKASSTMEVVLRDLVPENFINKEIATLGYAAIAGDTGNFCWNITSNTFRLGASLLDKQADYLEVVDRLFFFKDQSYMEMFNYVLNNLNYDQKLGTTWLILPFSKLQKDQITPEKMDKIKAVFQEDIARKVKGYPRAILIYEFLEGLIKISCRGSELHNIVDLAKLLSGLNGDWGGHFNACGSDVRGDLESTVNRLKELLAQSLSKD